VAAGAPAQPVKLVAQNRKARHDFHIEETLEAGVVLTGTEVKSCRAGRANLTEAYATARDGEAWLMQCYIAPYSHGNRANHEPMRPRKLLLHHDQIDGLERSVAREGRTLVPLRLYLKHGLVKVELAVAVGKKRHDKRASIAEREAERRMRQQLGRRR
jgi:SsrA-binding protein